MPAPPITRAARADGVEARSRILRAALALFAEKGFAKTSTREIALAAQANIAAISYYFGDKAGLFRSKIAWPVAAASGIGCGTVILVLFILFVLLVLMSNCSGSSGGGYRSSGGSYGGYSSGGGHK